jgi:hypothetical protein
MRGGAGLEGGGRDATPHVQRGPARQRHALRPPSCRAGGRAGPGSAGRLGPERGGGGGGGCGGTLASGRGSRLCLSAPSAARCRGFSAPGLLRLPPRERLGLVGRAGAVGWGRVRSLRLRSRGVRLTIGAPRTGDDRAAVMRQTRLLWGRAGAGAAAPCGSSCRCCCAACAQQLIQQALVRCGSSCSCSSSSRCCCGCWCCG